MWNKERYNWETDDSVGQILSGEVDSAISGALHQVSKIKYEYQNKIHENKRKLASIEGKISEFCSGKTWYVD